MNQERRSIRWGLAVIAIAVTARLMMGGAVEKAMAFLARPEIASFLLYLETGRVVRTSAVQGPEVTAPAATEPEPVQTDPAELPVSFLAQDAALLDMRSSNGYSVDLEQLLLSPLDWDLTAQGPAVLIVHTHATESYTQTEGYTYTESSRYRTLDEQNNMVRVGAHLAQCLEAEGIGVLHDATYHDYPSYTGSYGNARKTIRAYLEQYPSIRLVLDIHRDALETESGKQLSASVTVKGASTAQLMLVMGTDAGGLSHPNWEDNLSLAVKLHAQLEKNYPGICRPISFRTERFNQDLSPGALLVEIGAAGNTMPEALAAAEILAQAIGDLARGTVTAGSTS